MFGISFSELLLVGLVALLVLGPERLPGAARTASKAVCTPMALPDPPPDPGAFDRTPHSHPADLP